MEEQNPTELVKCSICNNLFERAVTPSKRYVSCPKHTRLGCEEYNPYGLEAESRIVYPSPWLLFGVKEIQYKCGKCEKVFWYTKGDMEEQKMQERFWVLIKK